MYVKVFKGVCTCYRNDGRVWAGCGRVHVCVRACTFVTWMMGVCESGRVYVHVGIDGYYAREWYRNVSLRFRCWCDELMGVCRCNGVVYVDRIT